MTISHREEAWGPEFEAGEETEENELHPQVIPWLCEHLGITSLGYQTLRYLKERAGIDYSFHLEEDPQSWAGHEQEDLLNAIRWHHRNEQTFVQQLLAHAATQATSPEQESFLRHALQRAQQLLNGRTATASAASSRRPEHAEETGEKPPDLLQPQERLCVHGILAYLGAALAHMPRVQKIREKIAGGIDARCSPEESRALLVSPLARYFSFADLAAIPLPLRQVVVEAVNLHTARLSAPEMEARRHLPGVSCDPDLLPHQAGWSHQVRLHIQGMPQELSKEMLTSTPPPWPGFPWPQQAPAEPLPAGPFPPSFREAIVWELQAVASDLSSGLDWTEREVLECILTGVLPTRAPVRAYSFTPALIKARQSGQKETLHYWARLKTGKRLRGAIILEVEPWVSGPTVQKYYQYYQRKMHLKARQAGAPQQQAALPSEARVLHRVPSETQALILQRIALAYQQPSERTPNWRTLYAQAKQGVRSGYPADYSGFLRAYKRTCASLDLPWDMQRLTRLLASDTD